MRIYTWKKLVGIAVAIACHWSVSSSSFERGMSVSVWAQSAMIPSSPLASSPVNTVSTPPVGCPVVVSQMTPVVMVPFNIVPGTVQYAPSGHGFALPTGPVAVAVIYPEPVVSPTGMYPPPFYPVTNTPAQDDSIRQVQYAQPSYSMSYSAAPVEDPYTGKLLNVLCPGNSGVYQMTPQQYQQIAQYQAMVQWQQAVYQQYYQQQYQQQYYQQLRQQESQKGNTVESAPNNTGAVGTATSGVAGQFITATSPAVAVVGNFPQYPPMPPSYGGYGMGMMSPYGGYGMGMMPPIVVLGNNDNDSARRQGIFARRRANRQQSVSQWMNPSPSLSGGGPVAGSMASQQMANQWTTPYVQANLPQTAPSVSAYPYGYFGGTTLPQQTNVFGGYYNSSRSSATIPGN